MTIVIAMRDGNVVLMGCDSASTDDNFDCVRRKGPSKIWMQSVSSVGKLGLGFCGHFGICMWIRHGFQWPSKRCGQSMENFLVKDVQPALQQSIATRFANETDEVKAQWELLVVHAKSRQMFHLQSCGNVEQTMNEWMCIGDASALAKGALHAMSVSSKRLESWCQMEIAFEACEAHKASVCGPFHLLPVL